MLRALVPTSTRRYRGSWLHFIPNRYFVPSRGAFRESPGFAGQSLARPARGAGEMELSKATVARRESKPEELVSGRSRSALQDPQYLEQSPSYEGCDEEAHEMSLSAKPRRPPFDLAAALKVVTTTSIAGWRRTAAWSAWGLRPRSTARRCHKPSGRRGGVGDRSRRLARLGNSRGAEGRRGVQGRREEPLLDHGVLPRLLQCLPQAFLRTSNSYFTRMDQLRRATVRSSGSLATIS